MANICLKIYEIAIFIQKLKIWVPKQIFLKDFVLIIFLNFK